ncbi:MAG: ubiquinone/menaquinone biosynthesis C-methylase UbiE [Myxococcota bacterium]|jgi:ubiquinone/menaquinone biosynthesis C-methylase UbiE/DNA-binding transcriptional ArsR family regulator
MSTAKGQSASGGGLHVHLSLLAEPIRTRLLRLVEQHELGVGELAKIVQLPQSTVSRHLKVLRQHGWIARRAQGSASLIRFAGETLPAASQSLWALVRESPEAQTEPDARRLVSVLAQRSVDSKAFFGRVAATWDQLRDEHFGHAFVPDALAALLPPAWVVADLGCGTGENVARLARWATQVIGVDREPSMVDAARKRLADIANVSVEVGELTELPITDATCDAAMMVLVLHHVDGLEPVFSEVSRILRPGGRLVIVDMIEHGRDSYRHTMGHVHLGFSEATLREYAVKAGLAMVGFRRLAADPDALGPGLFVATFEANAS